MNAWKPHRPVPVEKTWNDFVATTVGVRASQLAEVDPALENADYVFRRDGVVAELKEVERELTSAPRVKRDFNAIMEKLLDEDPAWRPPMLGGDGQFPAWFHRAYARTFRPPFTRLCNKANRQIRSTKRQLSIQTPTGVLILVNDGFTAIPPDWTRSLVSDVLLNSYSSIDCCIYMTLNRYVALPGSDLAHLLWAPVYSDRAADSLVEFVNNLGRKWFDYLDVLLGAAVDRRESESDDILKGSKPIRFKPSDSP